MSHRLTHLQLLARGCALVSVGALAACSSGSSSSSGPSTTKPTPSASVNATAGLVGVVSAGQPAELSAADKTAVLHAVDAYVRAATLLPLKGKPSNLDALFASGAAPAATAPERDALTEDGLPAVTGGAKATLVPVSMSGLADASGAIDLVGTTIDLTVTGTAPKGAITIHRSGELMFERDGSDWKILSFKLAVTRDGAGLGTASSTTTGSSTP
ncbi:MAG: hypothetical protein ABJC79_17020 [Acidimicrobiia bacterium]